VKVRRVASAPCRRPISTAADVIVRTTGERRRWRRCYGAHGGCRATQPIVTSYAYDSLYRLQQIQSRRTNPTTGTVIQDLSYQYYASGEQSNITDAVAGENLRYTYDDLGRLTMAQQQLGASPAPRS
jgi:YD repeat-containing protein